MTTEPTDRPDPEVEQDTIEGVWTQADTPGSDVELEKLVNPAEEATTEISADLSGLAAPESPLSPISPVEEIEFPESDVAAKAEVTTRVIEDSDDPDPRVADVEAAIQRANEEAADRARAEAQRLAAERAARNRALGVVAATGAEVVVAPPPQKLATDKFLGAMGLFVLRWIVAAIVGVHAYQLLTGIPAFQAELGITQLPSPNIMAWVAAISALLIALALLLGVFVRIAGFGLAAMAVLALVFLRWGNFSPFVSGQVGFLGELEFLLAGVGLLFLCFGGGLWGIDGIFRRRRAKARAAEAD